MPLQNRVTPCSEIIVVAARGTMMGNRGIIHDAETRQLLSRRWQHQAWVCCVLSFKNQQHPIMGRSSYTELFFLDEATAFAAGHRPCAYCRRTDFNAFKRAWAQAHGGTAEDLRAPVIDRKLHRERSTRQRAQVTYKTTLADLPDGVFVKIDNEPWLIQGHRLLHWSPQGYDAARERPMENTVEVLTPQSTVAAFAHGYRAQVHTSSENS